MTGRIYSSAAGVARIRVDSRHGDLTGASRSTIVEPMRDGKVILIHGFSNDDAFRVMRAVKAAVADPGEIAFAVSTPTNLDWRIRDLVDQVRLDHEYMKQNPPDPQKGIND